MDLPVKRVVVTGIGALTPLGNTMAKSFGALLEGLSGLGPIAGFDASGLKHSVAGELKGFDASAFVPPKDVLRYDPFVLYAWAAASMAVADAGLAPGALGPAAVFIGSCRGGIGSLEAAMGARATSYLMPGTTISMAASHISRGLGTHGPVLGISNACASGANALGEAMRLVASGRAPLALAGGAEAPVTELCLRGYGATGALSAAGVMRPFDTGRDGFVLAEGAAVLVLEELEHALDRGAHPYAECLGYGNASDASHPTVPDSRGQVRAMEAALKEANIDKVEYLNAHATSTVLGDDVEARSIASIPALGDALVGATKSMTGHMLGASGAFEAAVTVMSMREGVLHPTANLANPAAKGLKHIVGGPLRKKVATAMSTSFGFGGVNAALLFGAMD